MLTKIRNKTEGFTIIEVLIVLAIAGLIMVIVFLAVPALQRNSRNTQYREEANNLLAAYQEISNNKGGAVLSSAADRTAIVSASNTKTITGITLAAHSATDPAPTLTNAVIRTGAKCAAADSLTATAGSTRQIAIYFLVETSGGTQPQCVAS